MSSCVCEKQGILAEAGMGAREQQRGRRGFWWVRSAGGWGEVKGHVSWRWEREVLPPAEKVSRLP